MSQDYVLGTHHNELQRRGVQHGVWQPIVHETWRRVGIGPASHVIDVGAGPGYAARDLAHLVGPHGRVLAVEQSSAFIQALEEARTQQKLGEIDILHSPSEASPRTYSA
jgi:precorrin-6B methylase 2